MKKHIVIFLLIALFSSVRGNVLTPRAWISEILVDSAGNWTLEMGFHEWDNFEIDSIRVVTSSGSGLILSYTLISAGDFSDFDSLAVITDANLADPVSMCQSGDYVQLISYIWEEEPFDYVAFGDFPGSYLDCLRDGESVACLQSGIFCIDSSPTIGSGDAGSGLGGNYSGIAYDLLGNPFTEGTIHIPGLYGLLDIDLNTNGMFDEIVYSRRYTFDTIELWIQPWPYTKYTYAIEPVNFCLSPDSAYIQDIITTSLVISIKEKEKDDENLVVISPNPFSENVTFYFNLKNNYPSDEISLSIFSLDGREINRIQLFPDQKRYEWAPKGSVSAGTFIYRLDKNTKTLKTGKFIKI